MSCTDWPEEPVAGDQHTLGGVTYTFDGEKWKGNSNIFNYDRETRWSSVPLTGNPGDPTTAPANWNSSGDETSNWKAERERKIGLWSPWVVTKLRGSDAVDSFTSFVYTRANVKPAQPVGGSFESPVPVGFSDGIPAGELQVWQSQRVFYSDGSEAVVGGVNENDWTDLQPITDTFTTDYEWSSVEVNPGNPTDNPENWSNVASETTIWKAERYKVNGEWGAWTVVRIRGENGEPGTNGTASNLPYTAFCFIKSETVPATPPDSEGSWLNPVPAGWEDGIPEGDFQLYQIKRVFTTDGLAPQDASWSVPAAISNSSTAQYKWSSVQVNPGTPDTNPENWEDVGTTTTVWQAFRQIINGVAQAWQIVKIKGESGDNVGRGFNFFKVGTATGIWSDSDALTPLPLNTPVVNDVVTIYKISDPNVNVTKFWNGAAWELPADGGLFLGSIIVDGSIISRHVAASISITTPRVNGGTLNGTFLQLFGDNIMIIESPTPFGPDNLLYWVGTKATSGGTPDTIAPVYTAVTKALGKFWIDKDGNVGVSGQVNATSGEFNNVTIKENCIILGTLSVDKITGVLTKSQAHSVAEVEVTGSTASASWNTMLTLNVAANPSGLDSTFWLNDLVINGGVAWESGGYAAGSAIEAQVLVNSVVVKKFSSALAGGSSALALGTITVSGGESLGKAAAVVTVQARLVPTGTWDPFDSYILMPAQKVLLNLIPTSASGILTP